MAYAEIETIQRPAKIVLEPAGWGMPYQMLHNQTDVSGYEMFLLESIDKFNNAFQQAMQGVYDQRGWFELILRDVVRNSGRGTDDKGRLNIDYVSHSGMEWEKKRNVWAPKSGEFYVPNGDCEIINGVVIPFVPGTLVPFETVPNRREAIERFEKYDLNPAYVSRFYRRDNYDDGERFAGRCFDPVIDGDGRFIAYLDGRPSDSGVDWVASLPAYKEQEAVMKASALPQKVRA